MAVILSDAFTGTNGDAWNASNWTTRLVGGTGSATIQSATGELTVATGAYAVAVALGAPASGTCDDLDLLFPWVDASGGEQYIDIDYRIGTNATSGIPASCFRVEISHNSDKVGIYSIDSGGTFSTGIEVTTAGVNDLATHWMRILVVGDRHRVKWWDDGSGEPGTWQIDEATSIEAGTEVEDRDELARAMRRMSPRGRAVLVARVGGEKAVSIAARLGVSPARVSQIVNEAKRAGMAGGRQAWPTS